MAPPLIISTVPVSGATGVPVNTRIEITFDQEIDLYRLRNGGVIIEGPDQSKSIGPGYLHLQPPDTVEEDFLTSPGYKGIVDADYAFKRVDGSGVEVNYYDYGDTGSAGTIFRTRVVLTPKKPLSALTEYSVYIIGDEDATDAYDFGLTTRSIFDPRKGANIGNGEVVFYGGYVGTVRQQFFIQITSAGISGVATYEWWTDTDPVHRTNVSSVGYRLLKEGVKVKFLQGLNFAVGDTFSVWCDAPEFMVGSAKFSFTTSNQAPTVLPAPSVPAGPGGGGGPGPSGSLAVLSTMPVDRQALVDPTITDITVLFSANLNAATVTDTTVTLEGHAADDSVGGPAFTPNITKTLLVAGATLTITPDPGQIFDNNIVIVRLSASIADVGGLILGSDYEFFFGTTLTPYYAGIRHVRLRLGAIGNYFPDETIALAIWDASRVADAYTPAVIVNPAAFNEARRQFVVCYAAYELVAGGASASGGSVRKRLGDFDVSRSGGSSSSGGLDDALKECWEKYLALIEAGGDPEAAEEGIPSLALQIPQGVVKGDYDVDATHYGRLWEVPITPSPPLANVRALYVGSRRWIRSNYRRER